MEGSVVGVGVEVLVSELVDAVDVVPVAATGVVDLTVVSTVDCLLVCTFPEFSVVVEVVPAIYLNFSILVIVSP